MLWSTLHFSLCNSIVNLKKIRAILLGQVWNPITSLGFEIIFLVKFQSDQFCELRFLLSNFWENRLILNLDQVEKAQTHSCGEDLKTL